MTFSDSEPIWKFSLSEFESVTYEINLESRFWMVAELNLQFHACCLGNRINRTGWRINGINGTGWKINEINGTY